MSVVVHSLQATVLARSSWEIYETVRIDSHSFISRVLISVRPSNIFIPEKKPPQKRAQKPCVQLIARMSLTHWISTGPTVSQSTCLGEENHWADIDEKGLCSFIGVPSVSPRLVRCNQGTRQRLVGKWSSVLL